MVTCNLSVISYMFKICCFIITLIAVGDWLQRYSLDEDTSVIESRSYFDNKEDVFPVLSMCFEQHFDDDIFNKFGENITGSNYRKYLLGDYSHADMKNIDYNSVSTNITEFILMYWIEFFNGTGISSEWNQMKSNTYWRDP